MYSLNYTHIYLHRTSVFICVVYEYLLVERWSTVEFIDHFQLQILDLFFFLFRFSCGCGHADCPLSHQTTQSRNQFDRNKMVAWTAATAAAAHEIISNEQVQKLSFEDNTIYSLYTNSK